MPVQARCAGTEGGPGHPRRLASTTHAVIPTAIVVYPPAGCSVAGGILTMNFYAYGGSAENSPIRATESGRTTRPSLRCTRLINTVDVCLHNRAKVASRMAGFIRGQSGTASRNHVSSMNRLLGPGRTLAKPRHRALHIKRRRSLLSNGQGGSVGPVSRPSGTE
jgi:hypothetical protein